MDNLNEHTFTDFIWLKQEGHTWEIHVYFMDLYILIIRETLAKIDSKI